jgi:hypothetical protein
MTEHIDKLDWSRRYDEPRYTNKPVECEFPQCYREITTYYWCDRCSSMLCSECAENHPDMCI